MSTFAGRGYSSAAPAGMAHGSREPLAVTVDASARAEAGCSPTTSSYRILASLAIAVLLGLVVAARAVVFLRRRHVPGTPDRTVRGNRAVVRSPDAVNAGVSVRAEAACLSATSLQSSPTTSIQKVLATLATALLLSLMLAARAVVHAGAGMPDGPMRALTLAIGQATLQVAEATHLTWPWDRLATAFGNAPQPALPPLLASGSAATPRRRADPPRAPAAPASGARRPASVLVTDDRPLSTDDSIPGPSRKPLPRRQATRRAPWAPPARARRARGGSPAACCHARAAAVHPGPLWRPTPGHALRLLVTGDSLPGFLGPILLDEAATVGPVRGAVDVHDGTGLTRPDFVDWSLVAQQQVALYHPDAVVAWMGGNDFQNMTLPDGRFFPAGTPAWVWEYQRRAEICMRIWADGGARRVYWLSMPPARDPSWAYDDARIDIALQRAAARVPGAEYLNILGPITDHGRYADYVYEGGQPVQVREADGVHVNLAGSELVAKEVLRVLEREWNLG